MVDKAHRLTDEKLEEIEKRLSAIYSRAGKEIQQTADEYFSKFAKQNEFKRNFWSKAKSQRKNIPSGTNAKDYR